MKSKRAVGSRGGRGSGSAVDGAMNATEEKVVRMRKGLAAPDDMPLGRVGQNHPATRAKLEEIERRAFAQSGRLDELREEAGLPVARTDGAKKQKIISRLAGAKKKEGAAKSKKPAKATVKASAAVKSKPRR